MDDLDLWDYRRRVAEIYRTVRASPEPEGAWTEWRERRDQLFLEHPQSPLSAEQKAAFTGLDYFPYDPAWRYETTVKPVDSHDERIEHSSTGSTTFRRFCAVETPSGMLVLYWLESYGGGVFLPFRDATSGLNTYGGGRYLLDTAKGADLGHQGERIVLDFNFAYHPSCFHHWRWSCPLAPAENRLVASVTAGERGTVNYAGAEGLGHRE